MFYCEFLSYIGLPLILSTALILLINKLKTNK
jgi:hypothetical protein